MSEDPLSSFGRTYRKASPLSHLTQNTYMCCSAREWGVPGNSSQVSRRALKWTCFLLPVHQLHQDYPPVAGDALAANHQKWPRDTSHHTTSDSSTSPPCHCSQGTKNSQSEALQMMAHHSSTLAWKTPWMEEPRRLQSMGSLGVRHD